MSMTKAEQARQIQDKLTCGHCRCTFAGTSKQAQRVVYEGKQAYCSDACRTAAIREKLSKPAPNRGACNGCGNEFFSKREAKFCGMKCYTGSALFTGLLAEAREKAMTPWAIQRRAEMARRGEGRPCLECGQDVYVKKSEKSKKYCSVVCYRSYMAKRFDRQIASPEQMALPQGYDAFLDREMLNCLVEGCGWAGKHLSVHMNAAHGVPADEFKRAAGFSKSTGVISKDVAQALRAREKQGVALVPEMWGREAFTSAGTVVYCSLEAKEHRAKGAALLRSQPGPLRVCTGCGCEFVQSTPCGRAIYCSVQCRSKTYSEKKKVASKGISPKNKSSKKATPC